jgi:gluconolactonase
MLKSLIILINIFIFSSVLAQNKTIGKIITISPEFNDLISQDAKLEVIGEGYVWSEGPVWVKNGNYLLFSDVPANTIYKYKKGEAISVFLSPSGYTGKMPYSNEPGSNGLTISNDGQLILCEHGDRRLSIMPINGHGGKYTLADNFYGKRFNSPNDVVQAKNSNIYFTDPPYGLPQYENDSTREVKQFGVYRISKNKRITLEDGALTRPNGVALSQDQKTLYVGQSDKLAIIKSYPINIDGSLGKGKIFFDASYLNKEGLSGAPDGLKADKFGNVFSTGPGGVIILNKNGKLIGRIETGQATSNLAWGEDGSTLFITADMFLLRLETKTSGANY